MSHALVHITSPRRVGLAALLVVLGVLAATAPGAAAATFRVDSKQDLSDANPGSDGCAASNGRCTLRAAFEEANAQPSDDRVRVPRGDYVLTMGQLEVAANGTLAVRGGHRHGRSTVVDARGDSRVIQVDSDAGLTLTGVTITGGEVVGGGGGILANSGSTTKLVKARVNGNRTLGNGGGIGNQGRLIVINSDIETNSADENGGGISSGVRTIELAKRGSEVPSVDIKRSRINNNDAEIGGGGIYAASGIVDSYRSTVSGNTAGQFGGGIEGSVSGFNPTAAAGGQGFDTTITLDTSTISSNKSGISGLGQFGDGAGGGVLLFGGALLQAENVTIAANTNNASETPTGAGLGLDGGSAELRNSIVGDNRTNGDIDNCRVSGGTIDSLGFNLENEEECSFDEGSDITNKNPRLGRLRLNRSGPDGPKGRGETHKIAPDSPAHDAGPQNCGPLDERGLARPRGPRCDIGAFERKD